MNSYTKPEIEIVEISADVITSSPDLEFGGDLPETPNDEW